MERTKPSGLLGVAQDGINSAGEAAAGILERYDSGQKTKGDQELARLLASTKDRESLTALVNGPEVQGLRLSETGVKMLNDAQGNRVDWANTDSTIRDRDGRLGIARDGNQRLWNEEGRTSELFGRDRVQYNEGREQLGWMRDNAGNFVNSEIGALNGGTAFSAAIDNEESGGAADQYDATLGFANRGNGVQVSQMTLGQASEYSQGEYAEQSKAWKRENNHGDPNVPSTPMGKFQIVGDTLRTTMRDLELPSDLPFSGPVQEQLGTYLGQKRVMNKSIASARAGLRNEWAGFKDKTDAELDVIIGELRAAPQVSRDTVIAAASAGQQQQPQAAPQAQPTGPAPGARPYEGNRGFGGDAFAQSMASSGLFTPQQILGQVDPLRTAGTRGDALNAGEDATTMNEMTAQANRALLDNPEITNDREMRDAVFSDTNFTPTENERRYETLSGQVAGNPSQLNPAVPEAAMAETNAIVQTTLDAAERANESNPIDNLLADSQRLASTDTATVAENVAARLSLGTVKAQAV